MELKTSPNYIKAISGRVVTGIPVVHGNIDDGSDRSWNGSFTKTIAERGAQVLHLWAHNLFIPPIAKVLSIREIGREELPGAVLDVAPDATGGVEEVREYLDTPLGNEILTCIKAGALRAMSYAYDAKDFSFEDNPNGGGGKIRNLRGVKLYEFSDVNLGMNEAAVGSKSKGPEYLESILEYLKALKAGARHSGQDSSLIDQIAENAYLLGATNIQMMEMDSPSPDPAQQDPSMNGKTRRVQAELVSPAIVGSGKDRRAEPVSPAPDFAAMRRQLMELDLALFN